MEIINSLSDSLLFDSLGVSLPTINVIAQMPEKSVLEHLYSAATVVIALVNIFLVFYIFSKNSKKDKAYNEKNRKLNLLKTLILDYNMDKLYIFFRNVCEVTKQLKENNLTIETKTKINEGISDLTAAFRQDYIDLFIAIDMKLYSRILEKTDTLLDSLTNSIFDEGINLSHEPKFNEIVTKNIRSSKTEIIKVLFSYSGE